MTEAPNLDASFALMHDLGFELRRQGSTGRDLDAPMTRHELAQDRLGLREQTIARGYSAAQLSLVDEAADFATALFDGVYRPDGRPFLSHAIGVASALVRYELDADIVCAALLHAAYMQRPAWLAEESLSERLRRSGRVELLVRGQPHARAFLSQANADLMTLNIVGAAIFAILAANEVDMRLSGEYRASGRTVDLSPPMIDRIAEVLGLFGVAGLAASAALPVGEPSSMRLFGETPKASFRLDPAGVRRLYASGRAAAPSPREPPRPL